MLNKNLFINLIKTMATVFSLDKSDEEIVKYCQAVYPFMVKVGIDDAKIEKAVGDFILKTEGSNFNRLPSVGDFLKILGLQPPELEQIAAQQAVLVFSSIKSMHMKSQVIFSDPVTNYILNAYTGGIGGFVWDHSESNPNAKEVTWSQKKFEKDYVSAHELGLSKLDSLMFPEHNKHYGVKAYGDRDICLANIEKHKAIPNNPAAKAIANAATKMRK